MGPAFYCLAAPHKTNLMKAAAYERSVGILSTSGLPSKKEMP